MTLFFFFFFNVSNVHRFNESVTHVSSQEKRSSEHQRLLDLAEDWMEEACHRLQTGERLSHHHITMYRYFCMATLLKRHGIAEKMVADFKVSMRLFQSSLDTVSVSLQL